MAPIYRSNSFQVTVPGAVSNILAFPGAEGFGAKATGGRGGQVIKVTNLNASGAGSLQAALNVNAPRIIVFDVSGVITGDIEIPYSNVTIAGQTAPGAGITIEGRLTATYNGGVDNIIIRFLRVRTPLKPDAIAGNQYDSIQISTSDRVILDHVSMSGGVDENLDLYSATNVTVQWCTIEKPADTGHPEANHNYGLINGPAGNHFSCYNNLFVHCRKRTPAGSAGPQEHVNNVAYNTAEAWVHNNPASGSFSVIGNYFKSGPSANMLAFFVDAESVGAGLQYWFDGNYSDEPGSLVGPVDPWTLPLALDYFTDPPNNDATVYRIFSRPDFSNVDTYVAPTVKDVQVAYDEVVSKAGCWPRDVVTIGSVADVQARTGTYGAEYPADYMQGLSPGTADADSNNDGIPDWWATLNGLNPTGPSDADTIMPSGYSAIEQYINEQADALIPTQFVTRPYFFQPDETRLLASISAGNPWATGQSANNIGEPIGFLTVMNLAEANRASYSDMETWNFALAHWLTGETKYSDIAVAECLTKVRANPTGNPLSSSDYQHAEDVMMNTAMVVDCCYDQFTASERDEIATYVNGALAHIQERNQNYWPFGDTHNNYRNNQHLAFTIGGICSEGWNASASTWRAEAASISADFVTDYTSPVWTGPQISEGNYYSCYVRNSLWAMRQYDAVMGTNYMDQLSFDEADQLNMFLHQIRPNWFFFHVGSEAANRLAPIHSNVWQCLAYLLWSTGNTDDAGVMINILTSSSVAAESNNIWGRSTKSWFNFYWPLFGTTSKALSTKTDRRLALPTPGGAMTHLRSSTGWDSAQTNRAAIIFHCQTKTSGPYYPGYSHAHFDQPGFQWCQDNDWLVIDPEYYGGIQGELGGSLLSDVSNIVTLASARTTNGDYPVTIFNEDNTSDALPHYYLSINAQPYWTMCTTYRREYVWLDDLQAVVIFDYVVTPSANTKTWRLHVDGNPSIVSNTVTVIATNSSVIKLWDLLPGGSSISSTNLNGVGDISSNVYRLTQVESANTFISVKVLGTNNRVSAATYSSPVAGQHQATVTINGDEKVITFYEDGTHANVTSAVYEFVIDPDNAAGTDYTSLQAWMTAMAGQYTPSDTIRAVCRRTGSTDDDWLRIENLTSGITVEIISDPAYSNYQITSTDAFRDAIRNYHDGSVTITGLRLDGSANTGYYQSGPATTVMNNCVAHDCDDNGFWGAAGSLTLNNCIVYNCCAGAADSGIRCNGATMTVNYCTVVSARLGHGINYDSGTLNVNNCYSGNNPVNDYDGALTLTNCASSDTTGSAGLQSIAYSTANFVNVTGGNEDLHLVIGSGLIGQATPISVTTDFDGNARDGSTPDIGAYEYS